MSYVSKNKHNLCSKFLTFFWKVVDLVPWSTHIYVILWYPRLRWKLGCGNRGCCQYHVHSRMQLTLTWLSRASWRWKQYDAHSFYVLLYTWLTLTSVPEVIFAWFHHFLCISLSILLIFSISMPSYTLF